MASVGSAWMSRLFLGSRVVVVVVCALVPAVATAQSVSAGAVTPEQSAAPAESPGAASHAGASDAQGAASSVTVIAPASIDLTGARTVSDAIAYAPGTHVTDFSVRRLHAVRVRGIGTSTSQPAVTTYIDGVPQWNAGISNIDLFPAAGVEITRGPQSARLGRNTIGGAVHVTGQPPALDGPWTGGVTVPFGSAGERGVQAAASGPVAGGRLGAGLAFHYLERDGFTREAISGRDLDFRSAVAARAHLRWTPSSQWHTQVILRGQRDRDGGYATSDLEQLRRQPFHVAHDLEGFTERDLGAITLRTQWTGRHLQASATAGFVSWRTEDEIDVDDRPLPIAERHDAQHGRQQTVDVRLGSAPGTVVPIASAIAFRWQSGVSLFTDHHDQDATNTFTAMPSLETPIRQQVSAAHRARGAGVYGDGTLTFADRLDVTASLRGDHERQHADLTMITVPRLAIFSPDVDVDARHSAWTLSPRLAGALRSGPATVIHASIARGYKPGGFNVAPPAFERFGDERAWSVDAGVSSSWAGGRLTTHVSAFRVDWANMQVNVPDPFVPWQYHVENAGPAVSAGAEVEVQARVVPALALVGALGYTHARFDPGVTIRGVDVGGHDVPHTPRITAMVGLEVSCLVHPRTQIFGRTDTVVRGRYHYSERNTEGQAPYALVNASGGVRIGPIEVAAWIRNAFDTRYIPVAIEYSAFAPSGFLGEMGRPRTFGISTGVAF